MNPILYAVIQNLERPWIAAAMLVLLASALRKNPEDKRTDFLTTFGFIVISILSVPLHLLLVRYCGSIDATLWKADEFLGWNHPAVWKFIYLHPHFGEVLRYAYNDISIAMALLWIFQRNFVYRRALLIGSLTCWPFYALFPAAGPIYYVEHTALVAPRNAMPSMHFFFALTIAINAKGLVWRILAWTFVAAIACATLGLGEHYVVDLVAAIPYTLAIQWAASRQGWTVMNPLFSEGSENCQQQSLN